MRRALLLLFFLTGATALGYQLVWTRMLANTLGHEMPAVLAVVTTFMGGLALGAWCLGGPIRRSAYPGRWYAGLEIFIGAWAMAAPAGLWLLPAMIAMGASFPAMVNLVRGRNIGALYACNTLGAVAGIVLVTWWLVPQFGLRRTILTLAVFNVLVGIAAWTLAPQRAEPGSESEGQGRLMATVFVTGLLAIGFEILGVRVLAQVMENTVYSFAAALAAYLLGTSLGAALYQRFGREEWFDHLLGATALVCLGSIFVMSRAQAIYHGLRTGLGDSAAGVIAAETSLALSVFLLPTMIMGAIFSLLMQRQPGQFSQLLAANAFGGALAPVMFGVLLLPAMGSKWALVLLSLAYFTLVGRWRWLPP